MCNGKRAHTQNGAQAPFIHMHMTTESTKLFSEARKQFTIKSMHVCGIAYLAYSCLRYAHQHQHETTTTTKREPKKKKPAKRERDNTGTKNIICVHIVRIWQLFFRLGKISASKYSSYSIKNNIWQQEHWASERRTGTGTKRNENTQNHALRSQKRKRVYICVWDSDTFVCTHLLITFAPSFFFNEREREKFAHAKFKVAFHYSPGQTTFSGNNAMKRWSKVVSTNESTQCLAQKKSRLISPRKEWVPAKACIQCNVAITIIISAVQ